MQNHAIAFRLHIEPEVREDLNMQAGLQVQQCCLHYMPAASQCNTTTFLIVAVNAMGAFYISTFHITTVGSHPTKD
jgi:hypothetical protein